MLCLAAGLFFVAATARASEACLRLLQDGAKELSGQRHEAALQKFDEAGRCDVADPQALFFQGVALNRLGRHAQSLERLTAAENQGCQHADLNFELGWSLLKLKRWSQATQRLERYEAEHPGRGQTAEFLGRAYLVMGQFGKAEKAFQEAMERDPALKPTVLFFMANLAQVQRKPMLAQESLMAILRDWPESPIAGLLRDRLEQAGARVAAPRKPWWLSVSASGGYNDNVISLGTTANLPTDIKHKHAKFGHFALGAGYSLPVSAKDTVTAGYSFQSDLYDALHSSDLLDHYGFLSHSHAWSPKLSMAAQVSNEFTQVAGKKFRNQLGARPTITYRWTNRNISDISASFTFSNYYFPVSNPAQQRNGNATTLSLRQNFFPENTQLHLTASYSHLWNRAKGNDFDYESDSLSLGIGHPLPFDIYANASYSKIYNNYESLNSLAGAGNGFAYPRRDEIDSFDLYLSRPLLPWLSVFATYDFTKDNSNIRFYNYVQFALSTGLRAQF